jgi:hypothetical protein
VTASQPAPAVAGLDDADADVPWEAVAAAVGLLTRRAGGPADIRRSDIAAGCQPGHLVRAMEVIVEAVLHTLAHPDGEAFILQELGLHVADKIGAQMTPRTPPAFGYLHRCRWANDGPAGRCPHAQEFPGVRDVPPFCSGHLAQFEPWVASSAAQRASDASGAAGWIEWARRRAEAVQAVRRLLGERPDGVTRRTPRGRA